MLRPFSSPAESPGSVLWTPHAASGRGREPQFSGSGPSDGGVPPARPIPREFRAASELEKMLALSPDMICTVDRNGCFVRVSGGCERLLGHRPAELMGQAFLWFVSEQDCVRAGRMFRGILKGGARSGFEMNLVRRDGSELPMSWSLSWSEEDQRMICIGRDISAARREAADLRDARTAAELASEAKSAFLANMSHEIRTPMNGVLGMTDILLHTPLSGEQRDYVETIRRSGQTLLTIVNDILDFSKIEAGKLSFEEVAFDPAAALENCAAMAAPAARAGGVELSVEVAPEIPRKVLGDEGRLRQVMDNLVSNAVRFTPAGGRVALRVGLEHEDRGGLRLRFEIEDTGIGLDEATRKRLFEPFTQADVSTTRKYGGTGLGLAICRRLVGLMGGEIGVESEPGSGSLFHFTARFGHAPGGLHAECGEEFMLPAPPPEPAETPSPGLSGKTGRAEPKLLLAEDNPTNQKVALLQLRRLGHQADAVANGNEVLEAFRREPYDVILMDCQMPELDGYETSRRLRALYPGEKPHIIALTASAMTGDRERCLAAGMNDYITKPLSSAELEAALERWRESRAAED